MGTMQNTHDQPRSCIELRHLRLVAAIAAEESVTRAAGRLHLSQSAVSHQLVALERELGTRLFDRVGKRMVPTAAGRRVLGSAERLLAELCALERDLHDHKADARVPLRITTSCYTSYHWLPAALTSFGKTHPRVELTIVLEATRRATEALLADEVDVAIVTDPPRDEGFERVELSASELIALVSPSHPVLTRGGARRGSVRWGDLRGAVVLVHDIAEHDLGRLHAAVRESWQRESGERLATPVEVRKIPLSEALVELARAGSGVGIVDRWTVADKLGGSDLLGLPLVPRAPRTFHATWRRANPRALPMDELVKVIRAASEVVKSPAAKELSAAGTRRSSPRGAGRAPGRPSRARRG
jgi:LysR family transcriptional regulator, regulator for metE and metH